MTDDDGSDGSGGSGEGKFPKVDWGSVRRVFDAEVGAVSPVGSISDLVAESSPSDDDGDASSVRARAGSVGHIGDLVVDEGEGRGKDARRSLCSKAWRALAFASIVCAAVGAGVGVWWLVAGDDMSGPHDEQERLLEIAENVVAACGDRNLSDDSSGCERLCRENMCCVTEGVGSCVFEEGRDCAVYAGCEALFEEALGLFVLAQRIALACGEPRLSEDESECDDLCVDHLCCFVGGEFSCADDESMNCAAYAGCEALVPEVTWN